MKEGFEDRFTKYVSQNKDYDSPVVSTSPKGTKSPFSSTRITLETKLSTLPLSAHVTLGPRSILFSITKDWPGMRFIIQSARFSLVAPCRIASQMSSTPNRSPRPTHTLQNNTANTHIWCQLQLTMILNRHPAKFCNFNL